LAPAILTASDIWRVLQLAEALSRAKLGFIKGSRNNKRSLSFYASVPFGRRVMEKPMSGDAGAQTPPMKKNTIRARGGVTGHNVRYVLAFGLAGIIIAFTVIALLFFGGVHF
jgi:hypothetical protein